MAELVELTDGTSTALAVENEPGWDDLLAAGFKPVGEIVVPEPAKPETKPVEKPKAETKPEAKPAL